MPTGGRTTTMGLDSRMNIEAGTERILAIMSH